MSFRGWGYMDSGFRAKCEGEWVYSIRAAGRASASAWVGVGARVCVRSPGRVRAQLRVCARATAVRLPYP